MWQEGEPYQKVSKWLGHATFVVTLRVYAYWIESDDEELTLDLTNGPSYPSTSAEQARWKGMKRTSDDNVIPIRAAR